MTSQRTWGESIRGDNTSIPPLNITFTNGPMRIVPVTPTNARMHIDAAHHVMPAAPFDFAIAVEKDGKLLGVIGMYADGLKCSLGHLWTSGEPLVGSVLYGAAWRACKALGYTSVEL